MDLLILKIIVIVIACFIASYTDFKKGYIYNWLSFPLICLGLIFLVLDCFIINLLGYIYFLKVIGIGVLIYLIGYLLYYFGKLGGGDIKLFIGLHLVLPYLNNQLTILWVILFSSLLSVFIISIVYSFKLIKVFRIKKIKFLDLLKSKINYIIKSVFFFLIFLFMLIYSFSTLYFNYLYFLILIPILFGLFIVIFEKEVKEYIYLEYKLVNDLEDGDVLAVEYLKDLSLEDLKLKNRTVIEEKDILRFKKSKKIKKLPIYYNLPKFGPFIFLGLIVFLLVSKYLFLIF
ncbi:MAG: A24 family peptidase [Candidatus ainarchaeum sp.]|nr:A24 family peptidase [Candidatus ainarchaeum sp.]MDD3976158.1 A24 family peptidase [Candidatus ainarchaeum sp.]